MFVFQIRYKKKLTKSELLQILRYRLTNLNDVRNQLLNLIVVTAVFLSPPHVNEDLDSMHFQKSSPRRPLCVWKRDTGLDASMTSRDSWRYDSGLPKFSSIWQDMSLPAAPRAVVLKVWLVGAELWNRLLCHVCMPLVVAAPLPAFFLFSARAIPLL